MKLFGATSEHFLKIPLIRGHYSLCSVKRTRNFTLHSVLQLADWLSSLSPLYNCNKVSLWEKLPPVTISLGQVYLAATKIC